MLRINNATVTELISVLGSEATATRLIERRGRLGAINRVADFEDLLTEEQMVSIGEEIDFGVSKTADFDNHADALVTEEAALEDMMAGASGMKTMRLPVNGSPEEYQAVVTVEDADGFQYAANGVRVGDAFEFQLPSRLADMAGKVSLVANNGSKTVAKTFARGRLASLKVTLPDMQHLPAEGPSPQTMARLAAPTQISGKVVNATGSSIDFSKLEIILFASLREAGSEAVGAVHPLANARLSSDGRFILTVPKVVVGTAYCRLNYANSRQMPIARRADDTLPPDVLLVLEHFDPPKAPKGEGSGQPDGKGGESGKKDCACGPADAPSLSGFEAASLEARGGAGDELASEDCPRFRAQNVVVDEAEYTLAIRVDQPQVVAFSLEEPEEYARERVEELDEQVRQELGIPKMMAMAMMQPAGKAQVRKGALSLHEKLVTSYAEIDYNVAHVAEIAGVMAKNPAKNHIAALLRNAQQKAKRPARPALSAENRLEWDEDPSMSIAVTPARGHLLRIKQEWVTDGYSLGALLHTTALAPGQSRRLAIVDWSREDTGVRETEDEQLENLENVNSRNQQVSNTMRGTVEQMSKGGSVAGSAAKAASAGAAGFVQGIPMFLGSSAGAGIAGALSFQKHARKIGASSLFNVSDATRQSAGSERSRNTAVVMAAEQYEGSRAVTEVVANYNHCHSLNIHHFEVLRHFLVRTRLADVQECLFIPLSMSHFDLPKIRRWKDVLVRHLPFSMRRGIYALDRMDGFWRSVPEGLSAQEHLSFTYSDRTVERMTLRLRLRVRFVRPPTIQEEIARQKQETPRQPDEEEDGFFKRIAHGARNVVHKAIKAVDELGGNRVSGFLRAAEEKTSAQADRDFEKFVVPILAREVFNALTITAVGPDGARVSLVADPTVLGSPSNGRSTLVQIQVANANIARKAIDRIEIGLPQGVREKLAGHSDVVLEYANVSVFFDGIGHRLFAGSIDDDISNAGTGDNALIFTPVRRWETVKLYDRDLRSVERLVSYLNRELEAFHQYIWYAMDPARRFMILDGASAPYTDRSLAQVVDNELVGIVGNSLVMPIARGQSLFAKGELVSDRDPGDDLLSAYAPSTPIDPIRVSLPTGGVHAEAVMGSCNSCEKIDNTRYWKWEEHPIPLSPSEIAPGLMQSRHQSPDLTLPGFADPLIAQQAPLNVPSPESLANLIAAMTQAGIFQDAAGLTDTQKMAANAFAQTMKSASDAAAQARSLFDAKNGQLSPAQQGYVAQNLGSLLSTIDGLDLPDEMKDRLRKRAVEAVIGDSGEVPEKPKSEDKPGPVPPPPDPTKEDKPDPKKPGKPTAKTNRYVIQIDDKTVLFLNFGVNKSELHPKHVEGLARLAPQIIGPSTLEKVVGHASNAGDEDDNLLLSGRRADALYDTLRNMVRPRVEGPFNKPKIVSFVGEGAGGLTIREQFPNDPQINSIAGAGRAEDPVERSVLLRLNVEADIEEEEAVEINILGLFFLLVSNTIYFPGGDTYIFVEGDKTFIYNEGDEKPTPVAGPTTTVVNNTNINIDIDLPDITIGDVVFKVDGDRIVPDKPGSGSAPKTSDKWIIDFRTPDVSQAKSLKDFLDWIVEELIDSLSFGSDDTLETARIEDSSAVSSTIAASFGSAIGDAIDWGTNQITELTESQLKDRAKQLVDKVLKHPAVRAVVELIRIGDVDMGATITMFEDPSQSVTGTFQGRAAVIAVSDPPAGRGIAVTGVEDGTSGGIEGGKAFYRTSIPISVSDWTLAAGYQELGVVTTSVPDDLSALLNLLQNLGDVFHDIFGAGPEYLEELVRKLRDFVPFDGNYLAFEGMWRENGSQSDKEVEYEISGQALAFAMAFATDGIKFKA